MKPALEWCEKTDLCTLAKKMGFNLIFVEMQKSVYLKDYYPQTRSDFKKYPTRTWLYETVFIDLYNSKLIPNKIKNYAIGLSTGGRGAAIMALEHPNIFSAVASLSGDFDPLLQKNDNLMTCLAIYFIIFFVFC